jgi:hypothetical protein
MLLAGDDHLLTLPLPPVKSLYTAALRGSSTFELRLSGAALSAPPGRSDDGSPSLLEPQDETDAHRCVEEREEEVICGNSIEHAATQPSATCSTGARRKGTKKAGPTSERGTKRPRSTPSSPPTAAAAAAAVMDEYDFQSHDFQGESRQPLLSKPGRQGGGATTAKAAKTKAKVGGGGPGKAKTRVKRADTLTPKMAAAQTAKGGSIAARRALPAALKSWTIAKPPTKHFTPTTEPTVPSRRARAAKRSKVCAAFALCSLLANVSLPSPHVCPRRSRARFASTVGLLSAHVGSIGDVTTQDTQPDRRSDEDAVSAVPWRPTHAPEFRRGKPTNRKRSQATAAASATPAPRKRARQR